MQRKHSPRRAMLCFALSIFFLTGCTSLTELLEEYYSEQGELILAAQNKVIRVAIDLSEFFEEREDYELANKIYEVEDKLNAACEPLQQVSSLALDGREADSDLKSASFWSLHWCQQTTLKAKGELYRIAPDEVALYLK